MRQASDNSAQARERHARQVRAWMDSVLGQRLLQAEQPLLEEELARCFGSFLLHFGWQSGPPLQAPQIRCNLRLGPLPDAGAILCDAHAWPLCEHAADVVVLQHALEFAGDPHALLREAAHALRPGGHLLVVGINPYSSWGLRSLLERDGLGQARCIAAERLTDWLSLLGLALEKRRVGCYRPPLVSPAWQARLDWLERFGTRWQAPAAGFYILVARKRVVGLRPLPSPRHEPMGSLVPLPVVRVGRHPPEQ